MSYGYDNEDDDDCGIIGTPFPALEADEIVSRKPDIDQTVRDERGRRRFHGAFTGGFSAGYWNTVGSAEGFTPKIFSSSRKDKFDKTGFASKPEDFMDDEDFGSFGIAPKKIHTKDDFVENFTMTSLKDSKMTFDEVIRSVFQPSKESIGKRLYRKMKRTAKLDDSNLLESSTTEKTEIVHQYESKTNRHGLGYKGMLNVGEVFKEPSKKPSSSGDAVMATMKGGKRLKISGEAFGYGALEDDDAMDIYGTDDLSQYDFEIGTPTTKKTPSKKSFSSDPNQLDGFTKYRENFNLFLEIKQKYGPPILPKDWKPKRISKEPSKKKSRWDNDPQKSTDLEKTTNEPTKPAQKVMNANLRSVILGESVVHKSGIAKKDNELEFDKQIHKESPKPLPVPMAKTPLSGYFASKFTRSETNTHEHETLTAGLNRFEDVSNSVEFNRKKTETKVNEDENLPPVRCVYEWHPHKILCKRFGVQNPYPHLTDIVGVVCMDSSDKSRNMLLNSNKKSMNNQASKALFANIFECLNTTPTAAQQVFNNEPLKSDVQNLDQNTRKEQPELEEEPNIEDNEEEEEKEEKPRPPIDLFKSIFASDEEEDDEQEEEEKIESTKVDSKPKDSSKRNDGGIFSGIDFDELEKTFDPRLNTNQDDCNQQQQPVASQDDDNGSSDDDDVYGPALPPTIPPPISLNDYHKPSSKSHKHKKKSSKKKKKKSSSNKKKSSKKKKHSSSSRKRKRSESSESESSSRSPSSSSDDDNDQDYHKSQTNAEDMIIQLIKKVKHQSGS